MPDVANMPGPGRSTSERALDEVKKETAKRNEQASKAARKLRDVREREKVERRRRADDRY